ncbi:hypothetical protein FORC065_3531 [Yersinia enterocolitica]|nr:hypothetical protein FORC065_3531 [Yersinia enterocolitica]
MSYAHLRDEAASTGLATNSKGIKEGKIFYCRAAMGKCLLTQTDR